MTTYLSKQLTQKQITGVDFNYPSDSSYSIQKTLEDKWMSKNDTLKQSSIHLILSEFNPLQAQAFIDFLSPSEFGKQLYGVQLHLGDGTVKTLQIKPLQADSTTFVTKVSNYLNVFMLSKSWWKNSFLKSRKELLENLASE